MHGSSTSNALECQFCQLHLSHGLLNMKPQGLLDKLDDDLRYAIEIECKSKVDDIIDYNEVRGEIASALEGLRDVPNREECPLIYHLDVAAMYPNIILTNRCAFVWGKGEALEVVVCVCVCVSEEREKERERASERAR